MVKEIIINGVDVSKCKHFDCYYKECNAEYHTRYGYEIVKCDSCKDNPNCYFKQLKRKEQECDGLKKDLHKNFEAKNKLHLIIDRLLEVSGYDTNTASAEDFEDVYKNMRYGKQQLKQLGQTLIEIKKIAEVLAPMTDEYENCYDRDRCFECDFTEDCQYFNIKRIIQKISECEVNN